MAQIMIDVYTDSCPINIMREAFPTAKFMHIVRNGFCVAKAIEKKGWFQLEYINKRILYGIAYRKCSCVTAEQLVPDWLPKDKEQEFISATVYERGIIYWGCQLETIETQQNMFATEIKYEDMVLNPEAVLDKVDDIFHPTWTAQTNAVVSMFNTDGCVEERQSLKDLSEREQHLFYRQMRRYGYED